MVEPMTTTMRPLPLLLALLAFPSAAFAHRLDEYLQATLVAVEPGAFRLQINLTPGVAVAERVLALIDRDGDDLISTNEAAAYAELLKRDLKVRLDQHHVELKLTSSSFPEPADLRTGLGIIQMEFSVAPGALGAGPHKLTLENRHLPALSVYLFNAAQPRSASVRITGQRRNQDQSTGEIAFDFHPPPNPSMPVGMDILHANGVRANQPRASEERAPPWENRCVIPTRPARAGAASVPRATLVLKPLPISAASGGAREAFGLRPACWRFPVGRGVPD
ncbi:MAG TPA: hypothetical protein VN829_17730 [Dongiaceae bacterium]|nr:hypothetical protein [Dongiaceae bacterium]